MTRKNAPDLSSPSSPGCGSVCAGDDTIDTDSSLEAPRRPRSDAQIAAFEKARAKHAAILAAAAPAAPASPAPAANPRKARADKRKKRGHLVRPGTTNAAQEDPQEEYYEPPRNGYMNFVIV